jgi:hypothetical protein
MEYTVFQKSKEITPFWLFRKDLMKYLTQSETQLLKDFQPEFIPQEAITELASIIWEKFPNFKACYKQVATYCKTLLQEEELEKPKGCIHVFHLRSRFCHAIWFDELKGPYVARQIE